MTCTGAAVKSGKKSVNWSLASFFDSCDFFFHQGKRRKHSREAVMQVLVLRVGIIEKQLSKQDMTTQAFISINLTCIIKWGMTSSGWLTTAKILTHDKLHKKSGKKLIFVAQMFTSDLRYFTLNVMTWYLYTFQLKDFSLHRLHIKDGQIPGNIHGLRVTDNIWLVLTHKILETTRNSWTKKQTQS